MDSELIFLPFTVYAHQVWAGAAVNDRRSVAPSFESGFGDIRVDDWPLLAAPESTAQVIGRVQGYHMKSTFRTDDLRWQVTYNLLFEDERFNGSSLQVQGSWAYDGVTDTPYEWSIVGGTGQFKLAQGTLSGTTLRNDGNSRMMQFDVEVFYRPETVRRLAARQEPGVIN